MMISSVGNTWRNKSRLKKKAITHIYDDNDTVDNVHIGDPGNTMTRYQLENISNTKGEKVHVSTHK